MDNKITFQRFVLPLALLSIISIVFLFVRYTEPKRDGTANIYRVDKNLYAVEFKTLYTSFDSRSFPIPSLPRRYINVDWIIVPDSVGKFDMSQITITSHKPNPGFKMEKQGFSGWVELGNGKIEVNCRPIDYNGTFKLISKE